MKDIIINDSIKYIGVYDKDIDLFENQYVVPNGITYNSYVIFDKKIAIMDTVDKRKENEWLKNLDMVLKDKIPNYLIVSHMEPDHSSCIKTLIDKYPKMKIVGNTKTFEMINQFFKIDDLDNKKVVVTENDELNLGNHILKFVMAPMLHWPEVMMTYDKKDKILFTADAFGKFGTLDTNEDWACEARRYYFGIIGKYGMQVQMLLKKIASLEIQTICPLHGPILKDTIKYIEKYDIWSKYEPENNGVFIAYASIYGNTKEAVEKFVETLKNNGEKNIVTADLCHADWSECIENAFRYDRIVLASSSYNNGVFTPMYNFLHGLLERNYQNRKVGIIENGSWAPSAARVMQEILSKMKNIQVYENIVTIKSTLNEKSEKSLQKLAEEIMFI